ncbi:MAG: hypothetical protein M1820_006719 [Bogoriella megaspora]|nr:MAG: hypothetical protein M1820_006719 [Bogoriella megaspora]
MLPPFTYSAEPHFPHYYQPAFSTAYNLAHELDARLLQLLFTINQAKLQANESEYNDRLYNWADDARRRLLGISASKLKAGEGRALQDFCSVYDECQDVRKAVCNDQSSLVYAKVYQAVRELALTLVPSWGGSGSVCSDIELFGDHMKWPLVPGPDVVDKGSATLLAQNGQDIHQESASIKEVHEISLKDLELYQDLKKDTSASTSPTSLFPDLGGGPIDVTAKANIARPRTWKKTGVEIDFEPRRPTPEPFTPPGSPIR